MAEKDSPVKPEDAKREELRKLHDERYGDGNKPKKEEKPEGGFGQLEVQK